LKLLQQAGSIDNIFRVSLLELYVSNGCTAPEILPPIEIDSEEEYKLEDIFPSEYRYGTLHCRVKYK
jgi:hypothetical protein